MHQQVRARWAPVVAAGQGYCHADICLMTTRWIPPGTPWDLGHDPARTTWTGPEHRKCNRADGARRLNAQRAQLNAWRRARYDRW